MNRFQKCLCMVDGHEINDFLLFWIFLLRSFFGHFFRRDGSKKWPEPKKSLKSKISFIMPVNHAKGFWNPFKMRLYFPNCLAKLWAVICEKWNIFQKKFLVKNHFKWLDLQLVWCGKESDNLRATLIHMYNTYYRMNVHIHICRVSKTQGYFKNE